MEKYLYMDIAALDNVLAACTDFKERQYIRGALRELKGIRLDGDEIRTYSFSKDSLKNKHSSSHVENGVHTVLKSSNSEDVTVKNGSLQDIVLNKVGDSNNNDKSHIVGNKNERFSSYLYAGNISSPVPNQFFEIEEQKNAQNTALNCKIHSETNASEVNNVNGNVKHFKGSVDNSTDSNVSQRVFKRQQNDVTEVTILLREEKECYKTGRKSHVKNNSESINLRREDKVAKETLNPECLPVKHPPDKVQNQFNSQRNGINQSNCQNNRLNQSESQKDGQNQSYLQYKAIDQSNSQKSAPPKRPRKISYRTSPFSSANSLSPISSSVSRSRLGSDPQRSQSVNERTITPEKDTRLIENLKRSESVNIEVDGIFKCRPVFVVADVTEVGAAMKADTNNKLLNHEDITRSGEDVEMGDKRMMSQGDSVFENTDPDRVPHKSKPSLSRKKRVESDSPRTTRIIRKKDKSGGESSVLPNQKVNTCTNNKSDRPQSAKVITKSGSVRRKLPQIPDKKKTSFEDEDEESVHERTIRLLQERRRERLQKNDVGTPQEKVKAKVKVKVSPEEIKKTLEEKLERSDSQRKACRVRRELQLLQRDSKTRSRSPSPSCKEQELSSQRTPAKIEKDKNVEKENQRHQVQRSKSDVVQRQTSRNEKESQDVHLEGLPPKGPVVDVVAKEGLGPEPMTPERKINIIGSLMQEEARLQELLRRSTNFSEKRRMRSEVKQLRERRAALEGTADVHPMALLRRSASVTAGMITPASKPTSVISPESQDTDKSRQTIEDLRKQLGETADYDEKKKIRLALRQLRQQTQNGSLAPSSGLQRSQSFVLQKSSQPISNGDTSAGGVPVVRSQSVTDNPIHAGVKVFETNGSDSGGVTAVTNGDISNCDKSEDILKHSSGSPLCSKPPISSTSIEKRESTLQRLKNLHHRKSTGDIPSHCLAPRQSSAVLEETHNNNSPLTNGDAGLTAKVASSLSSSSSSTSPLSIAKKRHSFVGESRLAFQTEKENNKDSTRRHSVECGSDIRQVSKDQKPNILARCEIFEKNDNNNNSESKSSCVKSSNILVSRADVGNQNTYSANHSTNIVAQVYENKKDRADKAVDTDKSGVENLLKSEQLSRASSKIISAEKINPNIPWLEDKKKSIPSNDVENLLSTLDIEKAFSQILDAVETFPDTFEMAEAIAPVIQEEDSEVDTSDMEAVDSEEVDVRPDVKDFLSNHIEDKHKVTDASDSQGNDNVEVNEEIDKVEVNDRNDNVDVNVDDNGSKHSESVSEVAEIEPDHDKADVSVTTDKSDVGDEDKSAIAETPGIIKSEAKIQLRSQLSLDMNPPESNSAITVIRDDDGAVTVQEVNKKEEGDTTITEWRRVRRTQSRTETRETDTITEKKVASPGGSSTVYEKDVSSTKRKLTSRGSNYFSRNNYHIRKMRDPAGEEIVEHEMSSETDNVSVSKNETWGDKSTASVTLNRDGNETLPLAPAEAGNQNEMCKENGTDTRKTSTVAMFQPSVQGEMDVHSVIDTQLGRPSGCPHITSALQDTSAAEGATVTLKCTAICAPHTTVTWFRGDNPLQEGDGLSYQFDESTGTCCLQVSTAGLMHAGSYRCVFKNSFGAASTSGTLTVKCIVQDMPSFLTDLQDVSVCEGHSLTLECSVMDTDQVLWYRDDVVQRNSPDFKQTFDGSLAQLEISEVYLDDFGTYSCCLKNANGEKRSSCKVSVIESESNDLVVPMFLRKPETQIVDETETAIVECDVIGSPEPTISWSCDKLTLTGSDRCIMTYDGRVARLILKRVTLRDNGKMECVAENSCGRVSTDCLLVVNAKKKMPNITYPLEDISGHSGKAAILECGIMGDPEPTIVWRKNGLIIGQIFDFKHSYKGGLARLEIVKACPQDSGNYECCASNAHGEVTTSCHLTIKDEVKEPCVESPKVKVNEEKVQTAKTKTFPPRFVPKIDEEQIQASKRQASKIMLVRQGSLRSMKQESQPSVIKRSGSFQIQRKKESDPESEAKVEKASETDKRINHFVKDEVNTGSDSAGSFEKVTSTSEAPFKVEEVKDIVKTTSAITVNMSNDTNGVLNTTTAIKVNIGSNNKKVDNANDSLSTRLVKDTEPKSTDIERKVHSGQVEELKIEKKEVAKEKTDSVSPSRKGFVESTKVDYNKNYKMDANSNLTKLTSTDEQAELPMKVDEKVRTPVKTSEKSEDVLTVKRGALGKSATPKTRYSVDTSDVKESTPLSKVKTGGEIRRSQSVRTPGSDKPEWLQFKLRKVGSGGGSADFKKFTTSPGTGSGLSKLETDNTQKGSNSLLRSQSVRDPEKTPAVALKDSTNSPLNTPVQRNSVKLTPVSERAKIFQKNENNHSSPSGKSSPTEIIAKALTNLSRTESLRSPAGQRQMTVQRSHSFKTSQAASSGDITLELSKQKAEGQDVKGDSDSRRKVVKLWDPDTAPTHKMDYSTINDEEELNKLLSASDNFDERKKIRGRLKEIREQAMKEWEEKKASRPPPVDHIKQKHLEADLEKKKKLEAFQKQAAEPHELKHLEVAEKLLRDKHRQADEAKKKTLENFDKMAGKTPGAPKAAGGRPAEEIAPLLANQIINATSPSVSGKLTVKTESWSSKDGVTRTSERTETWGAKPVNPFKAADAAAAKTNPPGQGRAAMARSPSAIKTMLLEWTKAMTREYAPKVEITNFSTSWNDGMAFCALIHHFYPDSFDFETLDPKKRRGNFTLAFDTAEKFADIAPLLDVEDMVKMKKPDWKCVFTYVQSFYRKLNKHEANVAKPAPES